MIVKGTHLTETKAVYTVEKSSTKNPETRKWKWNTPQKKNMFPFFFFFFLLFSKPIYIYIYIFFFFLTLVFVAVCLICHFSFDAISVCVFVCVCVYLCLFVCSLAQRFFSKWVFDIATPCFASSNPRVLHKSASFVLPFSQVIISGSHI